MLVSDEGNLRKANLTNCLAVFVYDKDTDLNKVDGHCPYYADNYDDALNYLEESEFNLDKYNVVIRKIEFVSFSYRHTSPKAEARDLVNEHYIRNNMMNAVKFGETFNLATPS